MISETLVERTRLHVRRWFARRMPKAMYFHDLEHTLTVTRTAKAIGQAMKLNAQELALLEVAALFHDTGYALAYAGHEEKSAALAGAFLRKAKASETDIARVHGLIMATRLSATPRGSLQQVLRDADSAKAGQADFIEKSELLRKELETALGKKINAPAWLAQNLAYLEKHTFFTRYARERYSKQKHINLRALQQRSATPKRERAPLTQLHERFFDRDLSWLSFNDRVLQEAQDAHVPLLERIKFLAIYSNNLDEFYRVRVASLRSLAKLNKVDRTALAITPEKRVERINRKALAQQKEFGALYREVLLPALARHGIRILQGDQLNTAQRKFVRSYFSDRVAPLIHTAAVREGNAPFIEDRKLYFACRLHAKGRSKERIVLVNIPSDELGRFLMLPAARNRTELIFLDDVIRICLGDLFTGHKVSECHAIKLSRDAELHLDEEFIGNVKEKVRKSLRKRSTGVPSRFLYDSGMPRATLRALRDLLGLMKPDLVAGGRYHNFSDLMKLPVKDRATLRNAPWPPVPHRASKDGRDVFNAVKRGDVLWHFPYHDFGNVVRWLQQAARDPKVQRISITLYRVAENSAVCAALVDALGRGKKVTVFVEVQARFDERSNLFWGEALEQAGAKVLYSYEHLKVHCKLCSIDRRENGRTVRYAYLGTGNFNERTSQIYADMALITCQPAITREVVEVFEHLMDRRHRPALSHLLMAPLTLRDRLEASIDKEIEAALLGKPAEILLKLNSLEDHALIRKLYDASNAGVKIRLIIRGICCLVPGIEGLSANIEVISIVDRYLEHTRVYHFHNGGRPLVMLSSADWMGRNLDRRIEVAFPVTDPALQRTVMELMELQWSDRVKARIIDPLQTNRYRAPKPRDRSSRAQEATYKYIRAAAKAPVVKKRSGRGVR
ncbi:MAG TPA: polyphosphate kinase 1 [Flavobacteriales bacterium]|nr:polyphosphate kinase 1 [Flavobacteriales bacterium]